MKKFCMFMVFACATLAMGCMVSDKETGPDTFVLDMFQPDVYVAPDNYVQPDLTPPDTSQPDHGEEVQEDTFVSPDNGPADLAQPDLTPEVCVPDCVGKTCGDNGCGGSCGICPVLEDEPCLANSCVSGKCEEVFVQEGATCDDGNACTEQDQCTSKGFCLGKAKVCSDGNTCTTDTCDPLQGCVFSYNALPCDGDSKCTMGVCSQGECLVTQKDCDDDGNPSTTDACDEQTGECVHQFVVGSCQKDSDCEDGNFCTADVCDSVTAKCKLIEKVCDDGIACTVDSCNPVYGCINLADDKLCPQGQTCYGYLDGCAECVGNYWEDECNDQNACTTDTCTEGHTCQHIAVTDCNDQNACTADSCDSETGECSHVAKTCNDGNACTADSCEQATGECQHQDKDCDDGNACTTDTCNTSTGECLHSIVDCDDNYALTNDFCDVQIGCYHTPKSGCTPNCTGKVCGDNGCGGSCGTCGAGQQCVNNACQTQPPWTVTVEVGCTTQCEAHVFYADASAPATKAAEGLGLSPYSLMLSQVEACTWGVEVAARVPSGTWPWYGCDVGAPSLTTVTVKVNGVVKAGVLTKHPWACGGGGEGNLAFSSQQLGCP